MFSAQEELVSAWDRQREMLQRLEAGNLLLEALAPKRTPFPGVPAVWSHRRVGFWKGWGEMSGWTTWERLFGTQSRKIPFTERMWWLTHLCHSQEWVSLPMQCRMHMGAWRVGLSEHAVALPEEHRDVSIALSCPTLGDPTACSPPGCSVPGILQARLLEGVSSPFSRGSSGPQGPKCRQILHYLSHEGSPNKVIALRSLLCPSPAFSAQPQAE